MRPKRESRRDTDSTIKRKRDTYEVRAVSEDERARHEFAGATRDTVWYTVR